MCAERQKDILENIKNILSYDGYLIYSTCTFNQEENEFLIEEFAMNNNFELVDIDITKYANLVKNNFTIRAIPGKSNTEGFTITVLQNKNDNPKKNNKSNHKLNKIKNPFPSLFSVDSEFDFIEYKEEVYLFRKAFENILSKYLNKLKIVSFGNKIANSKKSQRSQIFIPNHNISSAININRKNIINLSDSDCLRFLKGESLQLEIDKNNYYFVAYKNYSIGIVKITNGRANNLYPDNFRIKKTVDYNEPIKSFL
jgi:NOL1/NOP2/fmu family ribosome biogenesis protein